ANDDHRDLDKAAEAWEQALALGGPDAQAAAWRLGEARLESEPSKALEWWGRALQGVRSANDFSNPLLELKQVRETLEQACRRFLEQGEFERVHQLADLYKRLAVPGRAEEWMGEAAGAQAKERHDPAAS